MSQAKNKLYHQISISRFICTPVHVTWLQFLILFEVERNKFVLFYSNKNFKLATFFIIAKHCLQKT